MVRLAPSYAPLECFQRFIFVVNMAIGSCFTPGWGCLPLWPEKLSQFFAKEEEKQLHYLRQISTLNRAVVWVSAIKHKTDFISFIWSIMHAEWFRRLFLIILDISARQDKLRDVESFNIEEKHGDHHSKFGKLAININGNRMPHFWQFEFNSFLRVSWSCKICVSVKPRWMLGSGSMFVKIGVAHDWIYYK